MELFGMMFQAEYIILGLAGAALLALILVTVQAVKLSALKKRIQAFMEGEDGKSLEEEIKKRFSQIKSLRERQQKMETDLATVFNELTKTYQKSAITKYDAFREMGGKLSFVMVFLDNRNNGFLLNSVHSTTAGSYMYAKEIKDGEADIELSEEERETVERAITGKQ